MAYLNGYEVARGNAPQVLAWDSQASSSRPDSEAVIFEQHDITPFKESLIQGMNILAVHGLNQSTTSSDMLVAAQLLALHAPAQPAPITLLSAGALVSGTNLLAIHGLNASPGSSDMLILPELAATAYAADDSPSPPDLSVRRGADGTTVISWPLSASGWALWNTRGLYPALWIPATVPDWPSNGMHSVVVPVYLPTRFFRLQR